MKELAPCLLYFAAYFRDQVYEAVLASTSRSLAALAEATGCDGEVVRVISAMSQSTDASTPSPRRPGSRGESPVEGRPRSRVSSTGSRPHSSLSMLSNMTWSTEKSQQVTYLQ